MQVQTLENSLARELTEGEVLIWSGRPEPQGKSAVSPGRFARIFGSICCLISLVSLGVGSIIYFRGNDEAPIVLWIIGAFALYLGLLSLLGGFLASGKRLSAKNILYAITDRRVIVLRTGRILQVDSYSKGSIQQVRRFERPDESGDLIFSVKSGSANGYNNLNKHILNTQENFTAIANVRQVEKKLMNMLERV